MRKEFSHIAITSQIQITKPHCKYRHTVERIMQYRNLTLQNWPKPHLLQTDSDDPVDRDAFISIIIISSTCETLSTFPPHINCKQVAWSPRLTLMESSQRTQCNCQRCCDAIRVLTTKCRISAFLSCKQRQRLTRLEKSAFFSDRPQLLFTASCERAAPFPSTSGWCFFNADVAGRPLSARPSSQRILNTK